jgi:hypothetical protein
MYKACGVECKKSPRKVGRGVEPLLNNPTNPIAQEEKYSSKKSSKENATKDKILSDSPLGHMLKYCSNNLQTKDKKKQQMIKYCCFSWTQRPIPKPVVF